MAPYCRTPFDSLWADNFISRGAARHVFRNTVLKCPSKFDNALPEQLEEMEESKQKIDAKKVAYRVVVEHLHPNILRVFSVSRRA